MAANTALAPLVSRLCVMVAAMAAAKSSLHTCRFRGFDVMGKLVKFKVSYKLSDAAMMTAPKPKANTVAAKTASPMVAMKDAAKPNKMAADARPKMTATSGLAGFVAWPPNLGLACERASLQRQSSTAGKEPVMGGGVTPGSFASKDSPGGTGATWWVPAATASWGPPPEQSATLSRPSILLMVRASRWNPRSLLIGPGASGRGVSVLWTIACHVQSLLGGDGDTHMMKPTVFYYHEFLLQPRVPWSHTTVRQLLLGRCFDESAITWVLGSSFFCLRRRHQQDPSVVGMFLLRQLLRPTFNRRFARSVHPGACVFDAPAYTPHRHDHPPQCLSRRCCLIFWSLDLYVIRSFLKDLYVIWLL